MGSEVTKCVSRGKALWEPASQASSFRPWLPGWGVGGRALPWIPSVGQGLAWWSSHLSHGAASPIRLSVHLVGALEVGSAGGGSCRQAGQARPQPALLGPDWQYQNLFFLRHLQCSNPGAEGR